MAAAELKLMLDIASDASRRRPPIGLARAWLTSYATIWASTLSVALLVSLCGHPLVHPARELLALSLTPQVNPPPHLGHVLALAAHNVPVAAWPLLLGVVGAHRNRLARRVADALVVAYITANALPVSVALGAYGPPLLPYIPQLPLEWAGLALGASAWLVQRRRALTVREGLLWLALIVCALLCAGALETFAVPHR